MRNKKVLAIIAVLLVIVTATGVLLGVFLQPDKNGEKDETNHTHLSVDELLVRDILDGTKVDDIINDPEWEANVVDSTENYVMVDSDKFDFSQKIGVEDGYTNIYLIPRAEKSKCFSTTT